MTKKRTHKQETLAEFEDRKDRIKFTDQEHIFQRLHREFNLRWLFYRYFLYYEKLKSSKYIKTSKVCAIVDGILSK